MVSNILENNNYIINSDETNFIKCRRIICRYVCNINGEIKCNNLKNKIVKSSNKVKKKITNNKNIIDNYDFDIFERDIFGLLHGNEYDSFILD